MARGRSMVASVLEETPEIGDDVLYVAAVVSIYKKGEGNIVRVISINGTHEERPYSASIWKNRFLKYNGVSVSEQRAMLAEVSGRFRYTPFFTTEGFVMFLPIQVRETSRVKDDSNLGFVAIDQIEKVEKIEFIKEEKFLTEHPNATCALRLSSGVLIPSYHSFRKTKEFWDSAEASYRNVVNRHGVVMNTRKQATEKAMEIQKSKIEMHRRSQNSNTGAETANVEQDDPKATQENIEMKKITEKDMTRDQTQEGTSQKKQHKATPYKEPGPK